MNSKHTDMQTSSSLPSLVAVILCSLPHFLNISLVATLTCLIIWCYQGLSMVRRLPVPGLFLRTVAGTVLFAIAVGLNEGLTLEAFVTLLIFSITLKTFELRTKRDRIVTIILCYFLIFSSMLLNDSIFAFAYLLLTIVCITASLITVNFPGPTLKQTLSLAGRLSLQALPFVVVLFVLFPRIQGGLWGRPPVITSVSGFTDEISLNAVARIAMSNKAAFRVSFSGEVPQPEQLYWRGIVLSRFDGKTWREAKMGRSFFRGYYGEGKKINYTVTLEPHNRRNLFALDLPLRVDAPRTRAGKDYTWLTWRPVTTRLQYQAESSTDDRPRVADSYTRTYLQLPRDGNSRSQIMAAQWRSESDSDKEYIDKVLDYFKTAEFRYSLSPEAISPDLISGGNGIDAFLFDTKEGFCEYYASAFAYLMRVVGIPARLVAGYLGGEINPYGDYMVVRQSDAHVWCEVSIDGVTWQRIDPTLWVAPNRATQGLNAVLSSAVSGGNENNQVTALRNFFNIVVNYADLINSRWNQWVLGYSSSSQILLFRSIGVDLKLPGGVFQAVIVGLILLTACGFIAVVLVRTGKENKDEVAFYWQKFSTLMGRMGFPRPSHQGPVAYGQNIIEQRPDLRDDIDEITGLYTQLRFNPECPAETLPRFIQAVKSFKLDQKQKAFRQTNS
jgi:transglutaminase-like putative cysteine protease